ncbi:MAG: UDP-glucose/GDP-mannose dehydrogenase family protein [Proteobacteria bacterium]|nr:UDP-glucose/GDP-mannose dehydrogenase family protein [Pseudomonadota bacterium]
MGKQRLSVFGLGYVGTVSAACFAKTGCTVIGVDLNPVKLELIQAGQAPIVEKDLPELISAAVTQGSLRATGDVGDAISSSDISLVCVGTPSHRDGSLDVSAVERVCLEIGEAIARKKGPHIVVIRSTILPGTIRGMVIPALEHASNEKIGQRISVCNNPEFLREGTAVHDFFNPPKTVIGSDAADAVDAVAALYDGIDAPLIKTTLEVAEMVKYADNCWHAVKVGFGNEIGNICKAAGIDSHAVMDIFVQDTKLNISPYYLKPGFAFGGSCLPKDLRALTSKGRALGLELPLLNSVMPSNRVQIERAVERILSYRRKAVAFLGFSFKAGTDDMRESPQVELIERLIGKGCDMRLYDRNVNLARLTGANKAYILETLPHIASLMTESLEDAVAHGAIVVVGNGAPEFARVPALLRPDQILIDFVRLAGAEALGERYDGINW